MLFAEGAVVAGALPTPPAGLPGRLFCVSNCNTNKKNSSVTAAQEYSSLKI
jgi:hypothetical protein